MARKGDYQFYKSINICPRCRKRDAEPNKVLCLECADADNERCRRKREENKEAKKKNDLDKYNRLKADGICTYCKHEKAMPGKYKCQKCLSKLRRKRDENRKDITRFERVSYGLCYICGKNELMENKGVCKDCYEVRLNSIQKIMYMPVSKQWKNDNNLVFKLK